MCIKPIAQGLNYDLENNCFEVMSFKNCLIFDKVHIKLFLMLETFYPSSISYKCTMN